MGKSCWGVHTVVQDRPALFRVLSLPNELQGSMTILTVAKTGRRSNPSRWFAELLVHFQKAAGPLTL
jgi:hypothetical protein